MADTPTRRKPTLMNPRYEGDVAIPRDQPLMSHCGICGEVVVYAIRLRRWPGTKQPGWMREGEILEPVAVRGGKLCGKPDGTVRYAHHDEWASNRHKCPRRAVMKLYEPVN